MVLKIGMGVTGKENDILILPNGSYFAQEFTLGRALYKQGKIGKNFTYRKGKSVLEVFLS